MRRRIGGITKEKLTKMYFDDWMSATKIAQFFGVDPGTIFARLKEYDIPLKTLSEARTEICISKEELKRLYLQNKMTIGEIGKLYDIDGATVLYKMRKYNIPSRSKSECHRISISKKEIEKLYIDEEKPIREVSKILNVCDVTIISRMKEYNIRSRIGSPKKLIFCSKDELEKLYIDEKKTMVEIGEMFDVSCGVVAMRLEEYEILIRSKNEHRIINFTSKDELERLYITEKKTMAEIGEMFGVDPTTVWERIHEYNILARTSGGKTSINTSIEIKMQQILKKNGYVFETHKRICGYYPDIIFRDRQILVECDGDYWHGNSLIYEKFDDIQLEAHKHDKKRDKILNDDGWSVIRFWETDINNDIENCLYLFELEYWGGEC